VNGNPVLMVYSYYIPYNTPERRDFGG